MSLSNLVGLVTDKPNGFKYLAKVGTVVTECLKLHFLYMDIAVHNLLSTPLGYIKREHNQVYLSQIFECFVS